MITGNSDSKMNPRLVEPDTGEIPGGGCYGRTVVAAEAFPRIIAIISRLLTIADAGVRTRKLMNAVSVFSK